MGASSSNSRFHDEMITTTIISSHHLSQICAQCGFFVHIQTRAQFFFSLVFTFLLPQDVTHCQPRLQRYDTVICIDAWYEYLYTCIYTGYTVFIAQRKRAGKITRHPPYSITLIFEYGWWMGLIYNLVLPEEILRSVITLSIQRFVFICITFR